MKAEPILRAPNGPIAQDVNGNARDADGNPVVYRQRYGLHEASGVLRLNPAVNARNKDVVTNERLIAAARSELEAAGEQSDLAIIAAATEGEPKLLPPAAVIALTQWCHGISSRHGFGRLLFASHFLMTWQLSRLVMIADVPASAKDDWLGCFGLALHRWHMEIFGEHANAYHGQQGAVNRSKGPQAAKARKFKQWDIIARAVADEIDDKDVPCKVVAGRVQEMNLALEREGEAPLKDKSESALTKKVELIRAWRRKCREAGEP